MILAGTATDLTYFAGGGSGTIVAAGSHNRLTLPQAGNGSWLTSTGNGDDIINALGGGHHTIQGGGHNAITLGTGRSVVDSQGDDTVFASGAATIKEPLNKSRSPGNR